MCYNYNEMCYNNNNNIDSIGHYYFSVENCFLYCIVTNKFENYKSLLKITLK